MYDPKSMAIGFIFGSLYASEDGGFATGHPMDELADPNRDFLLPQLRKILIDNYYEAVETLEHDGILIVVRDNAGNIESMHLYKAE